MDIDKCSEIAHQVSQIFNREKITLRDGIAILQSMIVTALKNINAPDEEILEIAQQMIDIYRSMEVQVPE